MRLIALLLCVSLLACQERGNDQIHRDYAKLRAQLDQEMATSRRLQRYIDQKLGGQPSTLPVETDSTTRALADSTLDASLRDLRSSLSDKLEVFILPRQRNMLRIGDDLLFGPGEYQLSAKGKEAVKTIGAIIQQFPLLEIEVAGHTDDQPVAGIKLRSNWDLSVLRATSVVQGLIDAGVSPMRIRAVGRGPYDPIDTNDREAGRYLNRRTEILLFRDGGS